MSEPNQTTEPAVGRSSPWSFSLRELFLLFVIASIVIVYFVRRPSSRNGTSNALFAVTQPIEFRYWHQRGATGSGTGQIGSGSEWQPARGIEVFENFVILHLDNGIDRMVERDGLLWFDWRRLGDEYGGEQVTPASGH